jgi:hypothetical protein
MTENELDDADYDRNFCETVQKAVDCGGIIAAIGFRSG